MGCRNPWRINIDPKTGWLYWGEVGPDARTAGPRGPRGYDEINQARKAGFFGWPTDPIGEALRDRWIDSTDPAEQKRLDAEIQAQAFRQVPFIPLGQYFPPAAWRSTITAPQKGVVPVFWEVAKS